MPSEPGWSKYISSSTVCSWFYYLAVLNALFAVTGVLGALFLPKSKGLTMPLLITGSAGFINAWALFIVCNRGINTESFEDPDKATRAWYGSRHPDQITAGPVGSIRPAPMAQSTQNPFDQGINDVIKRMRESGITEQQFNAGMAAQGPNFISNWAKANS